MSIGTAAAPRCGHEWTSHGGRRWVCTWPVTHDPGEHHFARVVEDAEDEDGELAAEVRARLRAGLSWNPIVVSINGHPQITQTFRTVADADRIADELTPVVLTLLKENRNRG